MVKSAILLLKMAIKKFPNDPREMHQRYITYVLWGRGLNGSPRGLLSNNMKDVDLDLLVPAIEKLIRNEDGLARSFVANAIKQMTFEQLTPLWDDIGWAVKNPSPSGVMFNATIREVGLETLAKYNFKETVKFGGDFVLTMKAHGSQERIYRIMKILKGFGEEAKHALPALYKAREYYKKNLGPGKPMNFPTWALNKFMKGLNEGIADIEKSTAPPPEDMKTFEGLQIKL